MKKSGTSVHLDGDHEEDLDHGDIHTSEDINDRGKTFYNDIGEDKDKTE
jgi:hypothetical protein